MKCNLRRIFLASLILLLAAPTQHGMQPASHISPTQLFDKDNRPNRALAKLIRQFNLNPQSQQELVEQTQKAWLRPADKERWEAESPHESRKQDLMPTFKRIGLVDEVKPQLQKYDYLLILGALHSRAKSRIEHAVQLWNNGIRFREIVLLGCERKLDPKQEPASLFNSVATPKTEYEMMRYVYEHTQMPEAMRAIKPTFINSPNKIIAAGKEQRATTGDTLIDWLKTHPKPGTCLIISNQPFIRYQESVTQGFLPLFIVDATGHELNPNESVSNILDSLARWIYTENQKKLFK